MKDEDKIVNIEISEAIIAKIRSELDGEAVLAKLIELSKRTNTEYHRGILHGYLLALNLTGVITLDDAMDILDQIVR